MHRLLNIRKDSSLQNVDSCTPSNLSKCSLLLRHNCISTRGGIGGVRGSWTRAPQVLLNEKIAYSLGPGAMKYPRARTGSRRPCISCSIPLVAKIPVSGPGIGAHLPLAPFPHGVGVRYCLLTDSRPDVNRCI